MPCAQCCAKVNEFFCHVTHGARPRPATRCPALHKHIQQCAWTTFGAMSPQSSKYVCINASLSKAAPHKPDHFVGVAAKSSSSNSQPPDGDRKADGSKKTADGHRTHADAAVFDSCLSLVQHGRTMDALALLQQLVNAGSFPERPVGDAILLAIANPAGVGRVNTALACLTVLPAEKGHYYYQLIKHYSSKRKLRALDRIQQALAKDARWKAFQQDPIAPWFALVQSYGQLQQPHLAAAAFDQCWRLGHWSPKDVKTANALLNALHADLDETYHRYDQLKLSGLQPDRVTFNTLLKSCMRGKNAEKASWTYQQMLQQGVPADEYTYTTLIKTYSYAGQVDEALNVQLAMVAADFSPSDTVWGSLITACGQAGQLQSALRLWEGFKEARQGLHKVSNPEPCQALLIACAHTYQMEPALTALADIKQAGVPMDAMMYNCAMNACRVPPSKTLPVEKLDKAFELLEEMSSHGVQPDNTTYGTLMNLCAEAKQGQTAYQLMQRLEGEGVKLDKVVHTAFMKACASSPGLLEPAHAAFKRMIWGPRRLKPTQVTFITMMRLFREQGHPHQALDVYLGMRRAGFPGVNAEFQELVQACAEAALENNDSELQKKVRTHLLDHQQEGQQDTVDLHSLSAKEARAAVLCVLANIQERFKQGKGVPAELAIIVGRGQHVQEEIPKLRDAVEKLLHQHLHLPVSQLQTAPTSKPPLGGTEGSVQPRKTQKASLGRQQRHEPLQGNRKTNSTNVGQKPIQNEGRVIVTQGTLLHWLNSKAVKGG